MSESEEDENINPNTSRSVNDTPGKKLLLPEEFFEFMCNVPGKNASMYKCLFPSCVEHKKKDGSEKRVIVSNISRHNAKRHYLKHDPMNDLGHVQKWNDAIKKLTSHHRGLTTISTSQIRSSIILTQDKLDEFVLDFLIVDVLPISTVEKPGFVQLVNGFAPNLQLRKRTFFTKMLENKYQERKQELIEVLAKCTDASSTADAWTCRRRSYLGESIHWFDPNNLERKSACLGIRRIKGRHTFDVLHTEFGVGQQITWDEYRQRIKFSEGIS